MKLFFDVETSGLPVWHAPASDPSQPHLVQLAALVTDDEGEEKGSFHSIIRPEGWTIPAQAAAIHGITDEIALSLGVPLVVALVAFSGFCLVATELVAHNLDFDLLMLRAACLRAGGNVRLFNRPRHICTMRDSTDVLKLPGRRGQFKWPRLEEAYRHFHDGRDFEGAHHAMADVRACAAIHFALLGRPRKFFPVAEPIPSFQATNRLSNGFSWPELSECAKREARMRERVFAKKVLAGAMDRTTAERETAMMRTLARVCDNMIMGELLPG